MNLTEFFSFQKLTPHSEANKSNMAGNLTKTVNIEVEAYKIFYNFLVGEILSAVQVLSASSSSRLDRLWG